MEFHFLVMEKSRKINVEKEGHPDYIYLEGVDCVIVFQVNLQLLKVN